MKDWHKSRSFWEAAGFAWSGVQEVYKRESNLRRQVWICVLALVLAGLLQLPATHIALIVLASGLVFSLEFINTALEEIEDMIWPEYRETVKRSKDIAAGAVLVGSLAAATVGLLLFIPPLAKLVLLLY